MQDDDPFVRKHLNGAVAAKKLQDKKDQIEAKRQIDVRLKAKKEAAAAGPPKPYKPQFPI